MKKLLLFVGIYTVSLLGLPGQLDPIFGGRFGDMPGTVVLDANDLPLDEAGQAIAMQPDRKIVVANEVCGETVIQVVRFLPDGSLDKNFGVNGIAQVDVGVDAPPTAIVLQPDGNIIVVVEQNWIQVRLTADGQLDPTFGSGGIASIDLGVFPLFDGAESRSISLLPDGSYIIAGESCAENKIIITKHLSDGSLDPEFGVDGIVEYDNIDSPSDTVHALDRDGKIVVTAVANNEANPNNIFVARFLPDGSLDTTFNSLGKFMGTAGIIDPGTVLFDYLGLDNNELGGITVQRDGKILVSFLTETDPPNPNAVGVLRLNLDGSVDASFNQDGPVPGVALVVGTTGFQDLTARRQILVQPDGKIILEFAAVDPNDNTQEQFAIARLNESGILDRSFGGFGINPEGVVVFAQFKTGSVASTPIALALQADGRILITGDTTDAATFDDLVLIRVQTGLEISKIAQAILGKYGLTADINRFGQSNVSCNE